MESNQNDNVKIINQDSEDIEILSEDEIQTTTGGNNSVNVYLGTENNSRTTLRIFQSAKSRLIRARIIYDGEARKFIKARFIKNTLIIRRFRTSPNNSKTTYTLTVTGYDNQRNTHTWNIRILPA